MPSLDLAALLCSRLCHDLVSPVGALMNGLEILGDEDDPAMREQVMELLSQSGRQTSCRLQFYRLAFGAAGGLDGKVGLRDPHKMTQGLYEGSKIRLDWTPGFGAFEKTEIKLLMNLILLAGEGLPRGGVVAVQAESEGARKLAVTASGEGAGLAETVAALIAGRDIDDPTPKLAPAILAARLAGELGTKIEYAPGSGTLTLAVHLPGA